MADFGWLMLDTFTTFIERRLPAREETFLVLSLATFLVFTWTLRELFYNFPAFILSYNLGEILVIAAYVLAFALLETLSATLFLLTLSILLPAFALRDGFAYKASFALIAAAAISIHLQIVMTNQPKINALLLEAAGGFGLWLVPVLLTRYLPPVRKIMLDVLDRLTIFSYLYLPLGVISLVVIVVRLLW